MSVGAFSDLRERSGRDDWVTRVDHQGRHRNDRSLLTRSTSTTTASERPGTAVESCWTEEQRYVSRAPLHYHRMWMIRSCL